MRKKGKKKNEIKSGNFETSIEIPIPNNFWAVYISCKV
jgi:hypothetical protein